MDWWTSSRAGGALLCEEHAVCLGVPELAELPAAEGVEVFRRIRGRVWRCGAFWRGMVWPGVVVMAGGPGVMVVWRWVFWPATVGERVVGLTWELVFTLGAIKVLGPVVARARRRALGRLARVELGTHCAGCDYDLRATPSRWGARVERCPECGRGERKGCSVDGIM